MASNPEETVPKLDQKDETSVENRKLQLPNWRLWREKGTARIWNAAMLSLNLHPSANNRALLRTVDPDRHKEYKHRSEVAIHRYGVHPHLPKMEHARAGTNPGDYFVELDRFLSFAKDMGWSDLAEFESGLCGVDATSTAESTVIHSLSEAPKGERYDLVRAGALLTLLEKVLQDNGEVDRRFLLSARRINTRQVAKELENIVLSVAGRYGKNSVTGFGEEANRKRLKAAMDALEDYFRTE